MAGRCRLLRIWSLTFQQILTHSVNLLTHTLKALNPETTLGDISYRSAVSNTNTRLGIGTAGQVLAVSGGVPAWTTTADVTPLTTKGDLFTFHTVDARIGVGADGTVLTAMLLRRQD
jgi:hypothetical protein